MKLLESKKPSKRFWSPQKSGVERIPNALFVAYEQPGIMQHGHWHAQVEVNYVFRGYLEYQMSGHRVFLREGDVAMFWGGLPHQVVDTSEDAFFTAIHLPLVNFFRLRLSSELTGKLTHGATLVTSAPDGTDHETFNRYVQYMRSGDQAKADHAVDELILRLERIRFEPFFLIEPHGPEMPKTEPLDAHSYSNIASICEFISTNFREDIDSADIAGSADIHPKYAMSIFKRSTGMTLNEYVNLLRLSYAQALLMQENANVLHVAMESGFGSLSAFNKSFRKIAGMSPTDFRRDVRARPALASVQRAMPDRHYN
ncbi:MAG TPA: helix-turn-helix domain-containing protein [Devosia sp.]|nr:helix-turn-helix domain-containing protein [Devosia sp.]